VGSMEAGAQQWWRGRVDAETIQVIEQRGSGAWLAEIQAALRAGRYRPSQVKRRYIPKADGKQRPLGKRPINPSSQDCRAGCILVS
jgi:hypothetical protein